MTFELARSIGISFKVIPVSSAVAEQTMHHGASECTIGARLDKHRQIGLLHRSIHVDVNSYDFGASPLPRAHSMGHYVHLGIDGVSSPNDHQIRLRHFARIDACDASDPGGVARVSRVDADGRVKSGVFLDVPQAIDAVAHHQAHRAGVVIGPDAFRAVAALGFEEFLGHKVERIVPRYALKFSRAFCAAAAQRVQQALSVMLAFGVARALGADYASRVVVILRPMNTPDGALVENLDLQRAGRRAIMWTGRMANPLRLWEPHRLIHGPPL